MGLPNDVPFSSLLIIGIMVGAHDSYHWTRRKASKASNYLEDRINETSNYITSTTDTMLYTTGLSSTSHIPRTFPHFLLLPPEIRMKIWRYSMPESRVIELRYNMPKKGYKMPFPGLTSICRIPPLLHACRESREEGLRFYELSFATEGDPAKVFVDFERDVIFFGSKSDLFNVQYLARELVVSERVLAPVGRGRERFFGVMLNGFSKSCSFGDPPVFRTAPTDGFGRIRFMALQSRELRYGNVHKLDYDVFRGLEEIVAVGERNFKLGPEPTLVREEREEGYDVAQHMLDLSDKETGWRNTHPGWEAPDLRRGIFVKGKGDKWYY